ncbi:MAG TPA: fluoride efflux transporter CrcB [Terrimesophilobacter sp.]|uniref:fluoride efflux transporter CrcB n=1 Tax=Terrimesophilobacter sp. TaxID=2906435 RepID=UPI002F937C18
MNAAVVAATVAAGGAAAVIRYLVSRSLARVSDSESFPWAVLIVNVVGSALGGVVLGLAQHAGVPAELQVVLLTGVCGGITTFSTFSVETIQLFTAGRWRAATLSVGANLLLGLGACTLGYLLFA